MSIYLSVVIPLFNEQDSVDSLYTALKQELNKLGVAHEIILVDDGSEDQTWPKIETLKRNDSDIVGIKFRRNFGQTYAMVAGFNHARGEIIITMDGDLQNDPADIGRLLEKLGEGYDIVSGWRRDRKDHFSRVLPSQIANRIISWTTGVSLHDYGCSLKAYRTECIKPIQAYGEMHRFFPALASMTGSRVVEIPVNHHPRRFGVSKYGFSRIFKVLSDILGMKLIIQFSSTPLKAFALCAAPFGLLALFFGFLSLLAWGGGWTTGKAIFFLTASGLSGAAAVHLIMLGMLAELVVSTSDLSHTTLPEMNKKRLL